MNHDNDSNNAPHWNAVNPNEPPLRGVALGRAVLKMRAERAARGEVLSNKEAADYFGVTLYSVKKGVSKAYRVDGKREIVKGAPCATSESDFESIKEHDERWDARRL